jgi:hypothetical protein
MKQTKRKRYKQNKALLAYTDNIVQLPRTRISYKNRVCGPRKKGDVNHFTCYTNDMLEKIRDMWNKKHPDDIIHTTAPIEIWR